MNTFIHLCCYYKNPEVLAITKYCVFSSKEKTLNLVLFRICLNRYTDVYVNVINPQFSRVSVVVFDWSVRPLSQFVFHQDLSRSNHPH